MNVRTILLAAVCTSMPVLAIAPAVAADDNAMANTPMNNNNMGGANAAAMPNAATTKDVRDELGHAVDAAASSDPMGQVMANLSKTDRDRMGAEKSVDATDLNKAVDQFRKDWQAKYGQEFTASDKASSIFSDQHVKVMQGNSIMGSEHPVNPNTGEVTTGNMNEGVKGAVAAAQNVAGNGNKMRGGDIKTDAAKNDAARVDSFGRPIDVSHGKDTAAARELGQQVGNGTGGAPAAVMTPDSMAMVSIPGADGSKPTVVNEVNDGEGSGWKVKLSSAATQQSLHDSLLKHVNMIEGMKTDWPSDVNEAYLAASKHLLMGIADSSMPGM